MIAAGRSRGAAARHVRLGAFALLVLMAGCTTGFFYNRVDWMVSWYVNGQVSLDDGQEAALRDSIRRNMDWHRRTQLPRYVALLDELAAESAAPMSPRILEAHYETVLGFIDALAAQIAPDVASILLTLNTNQIAELGANLAEDNEDLWDEFAGDSPEDRTKRRNRNAVRAVQRFVGSISREQRGLIEARLAGIQDVSDQWLERREHWQARFLALLSYSGPAAERAAGLRSLIVDPNQFDPPGYRQAVDANRRVVIAMLVELSAGLSSKQREHLRRKFAGYARDLRKIEAQD